MSISIAIPFFNAEKYLPDAIRSVFCQTFENWELILVDDGSTDRSLEIALSVKDPRVTVISDGQNKKLAARLNQIVNISKYSLLARMDADDMMHPGRLTIQHKILLENPEVDLTGSGLYSINNDCDLIGIRGSFCNKITHFDLLRREKSIVHPSILVRKSWCLRNPYDESLFLAEDAELWLRSSDRNDLNVCIIAEPLHIYREEQSVTFKKLIKSGMLERMLRKRYSDLFLNQVKFYLRSYFKTLVVILLNFIGCLGFLHKRRNSTNLSNAQREKYFSIVKSIRSFPVSGLDDWVNKNSVSNN